MTKHQIAVIVIAVLLSVIIYRLPRVVVDNDSTETGIRPQQEQVTEHNFEISAEDSIKIANFSSEILRYRNNKKSAIFADSLANLYLAYNRLDSAEKYGRFILNLGENEENFSLAGEIFFRAFGFSQKQEDAVKFAELAGDCYRQMLKVNPDNPDLKAKLAMTMVSTSNPMDGIRLLRDVLKDYPNNETAIYSLGVLSMQSGQYDKAVERFEKLIDLNAQNIQGYFYLAVSHFELGNLDKAKEIFEIVKQIEKDPAIIQAADQYLEDINDF